MSIKMTDQNFEACSRKCKRRVYSTHGLFRNLWADYQMTFVHVVGWFFDEVAEALTGFEECRSLQKNIDVIPTRLDQLMRPGLRLSF